jgi:hypothetical protein
MQNVSSSITVILKFALPTCWIVFFGAMTIAIWFVEIGPVAGMEEGTFRIIMSLFFLLGVAILYWAVMGIKRVEMDEQFFYVTNYFKNIRYPYHQIEKVNEKDYFFFRTIHLILKQPGHFGKKITFIPGRINFDEFLAEHPDVVKQLDGKELE